MQSEGSRPVPTLQVENWDLEIVTRQDSRKVDHIGQSWPLDRRVDNEVQVSNNKEACETADKFELNGSPFGTIESRGLVYTNERRLIG